MNPSLTIPTDNPYKLLAIIGAVIFVTSIFIFSTLTYKLNDVVFENLEAITSIENNMALSEVEKSDKVAIANRKIEIISKDRKAFPILFAVISLIGAIFCGVGFRKWLFEIYPVEEAIRKEQLKSLRLANKESSIKDLCAKNNTS